MRVLVISHCCDQVWQKQVATGKVYFSSWLQRGCVHAESPSWRGRSSMSGFVCGARMWGGSHHATAHMSYDRTHARLVQTCYHMTADMLPCDFRHVMPVQMCPHVTTDMASCDCTHVMWLQTCQCRHVITWLQTPVQMCHYADTSSWDCRQAAENYPGPREPGPAVTIKGQPLLPSARPYPLKMPWPPNFTFFVWKFLL